MDESYDVVVVGGGAAGLSGAVALARSRRRVLVVDAGDPRNAPAGHVHNLLGSEGLSPLELLARARGDLVSYGGEVVEGRAIGARALDGGGFEVSLDDGRVVEVRRLLVTTGLSDELPEVPGLRERWGRDVLHCPYCHGWEVRDQAVGILATNGGVGHLAPLFRQLTDDVVVFTHTAPPDAELRARLVAIGVVLVDGEVVGVEIADDRLSGVRLDDGTVVARQALVVAPFFRSRSAVLETLGLEPEPVEANGEVIGTAVPADPTGLTAVPGVWVAGNVRSPMAQVVSSAAEGLMAGAVINADLVAEETAAAVTRAEAAA